MLIEAKHLLHSLPWSSTSLENLKHKMKISRVVRSLIHLNKLPLLSSLLYLSWLLAVFSTIWRQSPIFPPLSNTHATRALLYLKSSFTPRSWSHQSYWKTMVNLNSFWPEFPLSQSKPEKEGYLTFFDVAGSLTKSFLFLFYSFQARLNQHSAGFQPQELACRQSLHKTWLSDSDRITESSPLYFIFLLLP